MKYTKEKLKQAVIKEIQESGKGKTEYAKDIGLSPVQLSQFIGGHIEYVPQKILDHYGLKKQMVIPKVFYVGVQS